MSLLGPHVLPGQKWVLCSNPHSRMSPGSRPVPSEGCNHLFHVHHTKPLCGTPPVFNCSTAPSPHPNPSHTQHLCNPDNGIPKPPLLLLNPLHPGGRVCPPSDLRRRLPPVGDDRPAGADGQVLRRRLPRGG
eukprot:1445767-Pyramimonas_sp.AAC.2